MSGALSWLDTVRDQRVAAGLRRSLHARAADGDGLLDLASNDYLGLTRHPAVIEAAAAAARTWGTGATGSRLVTGTTTLHEHFERELADFVGVEAALVLSSGYMANLAAITALTGPDSLIVSDEHNHASIIDACRLSRADVAVFAHRDALALRAALEDRTHERAVVVTDAVFSVDGEAAHLSEVFAEAAHHHAAVIVDEAHSLGVCGEGGRGLTSPVSGNDPTHVITATLSKAFGTQGGAVLGSRAVIDHIIDSARPFIFDTGLSPMCVAAARAALIEIVSDPELPARARANARHLAELASAIGFEVSEPDAAVVSIVIENPLDAVRAQQICAEHLVRVGCFRPPSVPDGRSRLRLTARADLSEPALTQAAAALAAVAHAGLGIDQEPNGAQGEPA